MTHSFPTRRSSDLGHGEAAVLFRRDRGGRDRLEEAGPAGAAVELRLGAEQRVAAAGTDIGALVLAGVVLTGEGALGPLEAADAELFRRQLTHPFLGALADLLRIAGVGGHVRLLRFKRFPDREEGTVGKKG